MARLNLTIRRCRNVNCSAYKKPDRPEAEGHFALPHYEFGLDVIALVGRRSVPEIRAHRVGCGLVIAERTVTNLRDRYDERLAVVLTDDRRLKEVPGAQGHVILGARGGVRSQLAGLLGAMARYRRRSACWVRRWTIS